MNKPLSESELILTDNKRIYHLDLAPEEIAETIITVGDPDRVPAISKHFDRIEVKRNKREFVTHTGYIGNKHYSVISTGISTDNIDIVMNEIDALHNICFKTRTIKPETKNVKIIRVGTSGALHPDIPVGSYLLSSAGLGFDGLLHHYYLENTPKEAGALTAFNEKYATQHFPVKPYLVSMAPVFDQLFDQQTLRGVTVTCGGFYGPQGRHLRAVARNADLLDQLSTFQYEDMRLTNLEMETAAIYGFGRLLGFECASLNLIIANRHKKNLVSDRQGAMNDMIAYLFDRLSQRADLL